jgi:hypothetical protein
VLAVAALTIGLAPAAFAQDDDDSVLNPLEPDVTVASLATNMRLPKWKSDFRLTHRFEGPLGNNGPGALFGLDEGAQVGIEFRLGVIKGGQVGFYRTTDKTIQFFGEYAVLRQAKHGLDISALVGVEGTNNFKDSYSPSVGAVISRKVGSVAALYVEPVLVNNSNPLPKALVNHNNTVIVGIGARVRIRPTVYLVGEVTPRAGYAPNKNQTTFGIEKRAGGHMFQLNVSNGFATMPASLARGAHDTKNWYLGFNLGRKFY